MFNRFLFQYERFVLKIIFHFENMNILSVSTLAPALTSWRSQRFCFENKALVLVSVFWYSRHICRFQNEFSFSKRVFRFTYGIISTNPQPATHSATNRNTHADTHTHTHIHIHITHTHTYTYIYTYIYTHTHTHTGAHTHIRTHTQIHIQRHTDTHADRDTLIHTETNTYKHKDTRIHVQWLEYMR